MGSIEKSFSSIPLPQPWVQTSLVYSEALSEAAGCKIHLKLDSEQPSKSFKSRGIGNLLLTYLRATSNDKLPHYYCSSGGNAGLACATAATSLSLPATIVVPTSTKPLMIDKIRELGDHIKVLQAGKHLGEADNYLRTQCLSKDPNGVHVPPFDHPAIWAGNATVIHELRTQIPHYDSIVCSVGGGGLLIGLMEGLDTYNQLSQTKIIAVETHGAHSLNLSLRNGKMSRLNAIESIATSLGATQVATRAFELAQKNDVDSIVVSDAEAACACVVFWQAEKILVEPACGASIAMCLNGGLRAVYAHLSDEEFMNLDIVILVCGGSNVTIEMLSQWVEIYGGEKEVQGWFKEGHWVGSL
ncbi:Catabolic L-serine/threonine dehydratase [Golovinomyces cichoracearum]|uniref:L-serine ammonia-lyase n=1 Tax=Golovinomyces cichoracearum TaxID=62708 RepID=A0A420ISR5_9PEZI|nr:Catabolic L-serine/threonine dehydratase [Golovinomyces cichoracearum]